jgi:hypothetical protein
MPTLELDHLVVAARTLDEGAQWCAATFGVPPAAGGRHDFMATHNRVFEIASASFPRAYLEIIAIDPRSPRPARPRWFDLDDAHLQRALARGPQLVHWVARCAGIADARAALLAGGIDCGDVEPARRATPSGWLRWQISVRADGHRPLAGAAPALIEWGDAHPTDALPRSGVALQSLRVSGWPVALQPLLPGAVASEPRAGAAPISAVLSGPRGLVTLESLHLKA